MDLHPFTRSLRNHEISGDEKTNAEYAPHNGSFRTYFQNKQIKLDTQAKEKTSLHSQIFANCVIYITGRTTPSAVELKRIIVGNGGQVCAYLGGKSYCTHVVAESLTNRKQTEYANLKVVKPAWITESVKLGRLQPIGNYSVLSVPQNQVFSIGKQPVDAAKRPDLYDNWDIPEYIPFTLPDGSPALPDMATEAPIAPLITPSVKPTTVYDAKLLNADGPEGDAARTAWILEQRSRVDCTDPNFLPNYFKKSRLHFLSTKKLELRHRCRQYVPPFSDQVSQTMLNSAHPRTLLHIDFDAFFVAVALKTRPHLRNEPVCVSNGSDGSDIASCNYIARQAGVRNGMWVSRAKLKCPNLVCLPYEFDEYARCSKQLYDELFKLLPDKICAISVDEAIIDATRLASARPLPEICELIRRRVFAATKISVSVGAGPNVLLAKMALRLAKPDNYAVVKNSLEIEHCSVRDLPGVGHHVLAQLERLGIRTIGALKTSMLANLQSVVGTALGQKLFDYAHGIDTNNIDSLDTPVRSVGLEIGWGVRVVNEVEMVEFVDRCGREVLNRLDSSGQVPEILTVKVHAKSPSSNFLTPKYLGRGLCDVQSRSRGVSLTTKNDQLLNAIHSLAKQVRCAPHNFRGIGIHLRVSDAVVNQDPRQTKLNFTSPVPTKPISTPPTTPPRKPMISVLPRKRRRAHATLTQLLAGEPTTPQRVDAAVFYELPSFIKSEILQNAGEFAVPLECFKNGKPAPVPTYQAAELCCTADPSQLRRMLSQWVTSSAVPTREDASKFAEFLVAATRHNSEWVAVLDLLEWLKFLILVHVEPGTDAWAGWHALQTHLETKTQSAVQARLALVTEEV